MVGQEDGESPENFSRWLMTLTGEQQEQFNCLIKEHLNNYRAAKKNSPNEPYRLIELLYNDLEQILTHRQLTALQALSREKSIQEWTPKKCFDCVYAKNKVNSAINDLKNAENLFNEDYCAPSPFHLPCGHPVNCGIVLAKTMAEQAKSYLPWSYYDCDCDDSQKARGYIEDAIDFVENAIYATLKYNCSPRPWLSELYDAQEDLEDALEYVNDCVNISCN
jgi:hypothetical protein